MKPRATRSCRGILLIEVVVAIAILSFGLLAVLLVIQSASVNVKRLEQRFLATEAARSALALLRAQPKQTAPTGELRLPPGCFRGLKEARCDYVIADVDPRRPGLNQISVTVTWSMGPTAHKVSLATRYHWREPI